MRFDQKIMNYVCGEITKTKVINPYMMYDRDTDGTVKKDENGDAVYSILFTNLLNTCTIKLAKLEEEGTTIDEDIDAKEKDIKYYESKGCKLNQDINSCVTIPNSSGWKLPLTSAWVTSEYQVVRTDCIGCGGISHRGIDLGASEGTYAYAAAKGRVAYIVRRGSCGGNMVYIYHTINGVPYTTVYMHLLEIKVNVDDIVVEEAEELKASMEKELDEVQTEQEKYLAEADALLSEAGV